MTIGVAASSPGAPTESANERAGCTPDVRTSLFAPLKGRAFPFVITAREHAVLAGMSELSKRARDLGITIESSASDGERVEPGVVIWRGRADASTVVRAEEGVLSAIGKPSGVATSADHLVRLAAGRARVVCGAWKKVAPSIRTELREAAALGGAGMRILDRPFVYLDKNYVRLLGGIAAAVRQASTIQGRAIVAQLRGEATSIGQEAIEAIGAGADVLMVDTGRREDLEAVVSHTARFPRRPLVAFGGGVSAANLCELIEAGADVLDVGRAILDAPMIDFRLDVA